MGKYEYALIAIYFVLVIVVTYASTTNKRTKKKSKKIFWFSLFLTPIAGIIIYLQNTEKKFDVGDTRYIVSKYRCDNCGYKFDENYDCCPICEKEGERIELEEVKQIMT